MTHTKATFTPGPWHCKATDYPGFSAGIVRDALNDPIADCRYNEVPSRDAKSPEEIDANARLIAAAPALYVALKEVTKMYDDPDGVVADAVGKYGSFNLVFEALAQADGKEQP